MMNVTKKFKITREHGAMLVCCGTGTLREHRWGWRIDDCDANIPGAAYRAIEEVIDSGGNGETGVEYMGVVYHWEIAKATE